MATFKRKVLAIVEVILRVPPVFLIDTLFRNSFINNGQEQLVQAENWNNSTVDGYEDEISIQSLSWFFLTILGITASCAVFMLRSSTLITFYLWLISVFTILLSYSLNERHITNVLQSDSLLQNIKSSTSVFLYQIILSCVFFMANCATKVISNSKGMCFAFVIPCIAAFLPVLPNAILHILPLLSASYALLEMVAGILGCSKIILSYFYLRAQHAIFMYRIRGLQELIEVNWYRVGIPQVLRVFWLTRLIEQALYLVVESSNSFDGMLKIPAEQLWEIVKTLLTKGCDTYITVAGLTSVLSSICQGLGHAFHLFLMTEDHEEERDMGTVSAVLFMILALQTGLTSLPPQKRFSRLYRNICLLSTAVLHFIHSMVSTLLMSLSASQNTALNRHVRALSVCGFLILFPYIVLTYLWQTHSVSTWLLAISAFSIEVICKVITSLMVYVLFMIDARRQTFWEKLDDYVYYIRSTGNSIEFILGIFLFFNGAWILVFESGGTIRACMMVIHAYCNIWLQAKAGWQAFMKRRNAVYKIKSLAIATQDKLQEHNDLCAICFQELSAGARITACNHIFHSLCLRKWLYIQDDCPLCHQMIYSKDSTSETPPDTPDTANGNAVVHQHQD